MNKKNSKKKKSIARWTPFKSIQRRKRQLVKRNIKQSPQSLHIIIIYLFFTKHKGKQKPYLKENRGCIGFELEGRKCYLESTFNPL